MFDPSNPIFRTLVSLPAFVLAIVLHEVAHGYVAYRCGDDTAKLAGRLTLSPLPHFEVLGTLMFILSSLSGFGFGWAKPVPVNPLRYRHFRRDDILVSLAGVATNLAQAVVWSLLVRLTIRFAPPSSLADAFIMFCDYATFINVVLMVFNLLPIPPLDGWHVFTQLFRIAYTSAALRLEQGGFVLLFVLMYLGIFKPVLHYVIVPIYDLLLPPTLF